MIHEMYVIEYTRSSVGIHRIIINVKSPFLDPVPLIFIKRVPVCPSFIDLSLNSS